MSKTALANTIPLFCSLCPNGPKFSDLSHLLTHVASRAHVANEDKQRALSATSQEAQSQLDRYAYWYETNEIRRLLDERQHLKESRPPRVRKNAKIKTVKKASKPVPAPSLPTSHLIKHENYTEDYRMAMLLQSHNPGPESTADSLTQLSPAPYELYPSGVVAKPRCQSIDYSRVSDFDLPDGELEGNGWPGVDQANSPAVAYGKVRPLEDITQIRMQRETTTVEPAELVLNSHDSIQSSPLYVDPIDPRLQQKPRRALGELDPNQSAQNKRQKKTREPAVKEEPKSPLTAQRSPRHASPLHEHRPPIFPILPSGYYIVGPDHQPVPYQHYPLVASYANVVPLITDRESIDHSRYHPMFPPFLSYPSPFNHSLCDCGSYHGHDPTLGSGDNYHAYDYDPHSTEHRSVEPSRIEKSPLLLTSPVLSEEGKH